jgi:hypothetical protein
VGTSAERHTTRCIHGADKGTDDLRLVEVWANKTPAEALEILACSSGASAQIKADRLRCAFLFLAGAGYGLAE